MTLLFRVVDDSISRLMEFSVLFLLLVVSLSLSLSLLLLLLLLLSITLIGTTKRSEIEKFVSFVIVINVLAADNTANRFEFFSVFLHIIVPKN